ncbi:MAG: hypothetical protein LC104_04490 [Bacteroidales bacterium]|nr:hypothetical protein [Bacteroidales bacterium]
MFPLPVLVALAAPPSITLPAEVLARPGRLVTLTAQTTGQQVRWLVASEAADLVPFPGEKTALFCTPTPGRYLVFAWTAAGDEPSEAARCVVVVRDTPPVPPVPPPVPPPPQPPAPPADPLTLALQKLYSEDRSPNKSVHLAQLAALYREAIAFAQRPELQTAGDLAARLKSAAATLLPADALIPIRQRIAEETARVLPVDSDRPLDSATRSAAAALFTRLATSLESIR